MAWGEGAASDTAEWASGVRDFCEERAIGDRIGFGARPAIVVIDMARAFTDPESFKVGCEQDATVAAIGELLQAGRAKGVPVFFTTIAYLPGAPDGGLFAVKIPALRELRLDDPRATEIDPRIAPRPGEAVIEKKYSSAFFGTPLATTLRTQGVDTILLVGHSTSGCVRATAVDGISHGFRVVVPREAVSDRAVEPHQASLFDIDAKYGDVVALADAVAYLRGLP